MFGQSRRVSRRDILSVMSSIAVETTKAPVRPGVPLPDKPAACTIDEAAVAPTEAQETGRTLGLDPEPPGLIRPDTHHHQLARKTSAARQDDCGAGEKDAR